MSCCNIWEVFDEPNNLIKEYKHWKLLVRKDTTTLGNCVAITKRHMESLAEINLEEMAEFAEVVKDVERSVRAAFTCDKFNYLMLMMKDRHTHFHILPRYGSKRSFVGLEWVDEDWPKSTHRQLEPISQEVLDQIKEEIKKNI